MTTVIKAKKKAIAYTIKMNVTDECKDDVTESNYDRFFKKLEYYKIEVEYKVSEKDKSGCLHYHGIFYAPKGFYLKRLMLKGFHMKFKEVFNKSGWIKYIHKDCVYTNMQQEPDPISDSSDSTHCLPDDCSNWKCNFSLFKIVK